MEMKLNNPTLNNSAVSVNPQEQPLDSLQIPPATELVPILLRREDRETFFHVPLCHFCRKPVLNFEEANVVVLGFENTPQEYLGTIDDAEFFRLPGVAVVLHFKCDQSGSVPWIRSSSIFCKDQRGPIEKLGWTGVAQ
jgi:hypothetical protein